MAHHLSRRIVLSISTPLHHYPFSNSSLRPLFKPPKKAMSSSVLHNAAAPGAPYFTPHQSPSSGTALPLSEQPVHKEKLPKLFEPIKIRKAVFPNRAFCAPMCMYSCPPGEGKLTDFHVVHLGGIAYKGAGLVMVEATSVKAEGMISPEDSGLWEDA